MCDVYREVCFTIKKKDGVNAGLLQQAWVKKTIHGISSKEKVLGAAVSKEGHLDSFLGHEKTHYYCNKRHLHLPDSKCLWCLAYKANIFKRSGTHAQYWLLVCTWCEEPECWECKFRHLDGRWLPTLKCSMPWGLQEVIQHLFFLNTAWTYLGTILVIKVDKVTPKSYNYWFPWKKEQLQTMLLTGNSSGKIHLFYWMTLIYI